MFSPLALTMETFFSSRERRTDGGRSGDQACPQEEQLWSGPHPQTLLNHILHNPLTRVLSCSSCPVLILPQGKVLLRREMMSQRRWEGRERQVIRETGLSTFWRVKP